MAASAKSLLPPYRVIPNWRGKNRFVIRKLPTAYQNFYGEWKDNPGTPVHWVPSAAEWERNPETGEVKPTKDRPIPVLYPHQSHEGIWGGEGVIEGKVKKKKYQVPVPRYWTPILQKTVVYSEILDKYLSMIFTERALRLIDDHHGLDSYLIKNPAYELKSLLALKLKKKLLLALVQKDFAHDNPQKQEELLAKYKEYLMPIEQLEWYGLSIAEAYAKYNEQLAEEARSRIVPLKYQYRQELIQKLKEEKIQAQQQPTDTEQLAGVTNWLTKLNPFTKPSTVAEEKPRS